jgi:hypothetical protein
MMQTPISTLDRAIGIGAWRDVVMTESVAPVWRL